MWAARHTYRTTMALARSLTLPVGLFVSLPAVPWCPCAPAFGLIQGTRCDCVMTRSHCVIVLLWWFCPVARIWRMKCGCVMILSTLAGCCLPLFHPSGDGCRFGHMGWPTGFDLNTVYSETTNSDTTIPILANASGGRDM
jgi:hypothetical protein